MNMSTIAVGVTAGRASLVSTCLAAWPLYCAMSWAEVSSPRCTPGCRMFIISRPSVVAMAMLAKNSVNVRPASGPRCESSPSCTTPFASEANTSGMTTKNSMRRNTCPIGSSSVVESHCAACSTCGENRR